MDDADIADSRIQATTEAAIARARSIPARSWPLGECGACADPIDQHRLDALPHALLCRPCAHEAATASARKRRTGV